MSNKKGVKVIAPFVAPEGTPVAYVSDIAGANQVVDTKADLTNIHSSLLEVGMVAFVKDEGKQYRLTAKSATPVASDWTAVTVSTSDVKVADDKTLADVLITKDEVTTKINDATTAASEAYQTKADALAAKTALEESIHAVSTAGLSEETKQDIQAAKNAAATLAGFQQTLDQTKTELAQKVEEAKQAALTQEDKTAIASIAEVKATAEAAKAKGEELEPKITANKEAVDNLKTTVDALPTSDAVDGKISTAKQTIDNSIDLVKQSVDALKTVVQGSDDGVTKGLDAKITAAKEEAANNLATAKAALEQSIQTASTAGLPESTKQDIEAAKQAATKLTEITSKVDDAVSKATDADTKAGTLETKVTALESFKTDAEPKLAAVDTVKESVDTLKDTTVPGIDARVTTLEGKAAPTDFTEDQKTKLDEILTGKHYASSADIDNAKTELKGELATQTSVTQLVDGAKTEAEGKVNDAKTELEGKITELKNTVDGIHVPDTSTLATKEELKTSKAIGALNIIKKYGVYILEGHKYLEIQLNKDLLPFNHVKGIKVNEVDVTNQYNAELGISNYDYTNTSLPPIFPVVFTVSDDGTQETYELKINLQYYANESEYVDDKKYIAVSDIDTTGNKLGSEKFAGAQLEDNNSVYNFKISLEQGTNKQIAVAITENAGNECNDIASCLSLNGQFGLFETVEDSTLSTNTSRSNYYYSKTGGLKTYNVKVFKLKTPLNPDGQNDTYVVTYHRPINHG